jgi:NAD(P)H-hydrate epimerase
MDAEAAERFALSKRVLVETAASLVERALERSLPHDGAIAFCAGRGGNGEDALVAARRLALRGLADPFVILSRPPTGLGAEEARSLEAMGTRIWVWPEGRDALLGAPIAVDGIAGTGVRGPLRGPEAEMAEALSLARDRGARIIAIDLPSGLSDEWKPEWPVVKADVTLAIEAPKACAYVPAARPFAGSIETLKGVFPKGLAALNEPMPALQERSDEEALEGSAASPPEAYKGSRGKVAIFAGGAGYAGAAMIASMACARSGAGLTALYAGKGAFEPAASKLASIMVRDASMGIEIDPFLKGADAVLAGPGWTDAPRFLGELLRASKGKALLLDAEALRALKPEHAALLGPRAVLSPHPGEMAGLCGLDVQSVLSRPLEALERARSAYGACVVLKSHVTWIMDHEGRVAVVDGMLPELGTAGSGDALAGMIAALLAKGLPAFDAARLGVMRHLRAGKRLSGIFSDPSLGFVAEDLARALGGGDGRV